MKTVIPVDEADLHNHPDWGGLTLLNVALDQKWLNPAEKAKLFYQEPGSPVRPMGPSRLMATTMGVPYFKVASIGDASTGFAGYAKTKHLTLRNNVSNFRSLPTDDPFYVNADFSDIETCTEVNQTYAFYPPHRDPEPHRLAPGYVRFPFAPGAAVVFEASKWIPFLGYDHTPNLLEKFIAKDMDNSWAWGIDPATYSPFKLTAEYHLNFNCSPDENVAKYQDREMLTDINVSDFGSVLRGTGNQKRGVIIDAYTGNDVKQMFHVIENGVSKHINDASSTPTNTRYEPDNLHITYMHAVDWPDGGFVQESNGSFKLRTYPKPGCPECVHMHWRWTDALPYNFRRDASLSYGGGKAIIRPGSRQDVWVGFNKSGVFVYRAAGKGNRDVFFRHGGFYSSRGTYTDLGYDLDNFPDMPMNLPMWDDLKFR
jgi:hypothetical protein